MDQPGPMQDACLACHTGERGCVLAVALLALSWLLLSCMMQPACPALRLRRPTHHGVARHGTGKTEIAQLHGPIGADEDVLGLHVSARNEWWGMGHVRRPSAYKLRCTPSRGVTLPQDLRTEHKLEAGVTCGQSYACAITHAALTFLTYQPTPAQSCASNRHRHPCAYTTTRQLKEKPSSIQAGGTLLHVSAPFRVLRMRAPSRHSHLWMILFECR